MIKLTEQSEKNSPKEYDRIFFEREQKGVDEHDIRRWKRILKYYKGGNILDAGCLDSKIYEMAKEKFKDDYKRIDYFGIDPAKECIEQMRNKYKDINCIFYPCSIEELGGGHIGRYDYVVLAEVLEHLEEPEKAIEKSMELLKSGAVLAISVPYQEAKEPGACDQERHLWSFSKKDMKELLEPYGKVKFETVGSRWFPYRYHWPSLIAYCFKK